MPAIVDKSLISKICVDDFAFRKRYSYGTVMVNLEDHRIIDVLDSRDTTDVENWLKTYPNLQVIARDGAQTYASASTNSHPDAMQVSDRFHLLKNLSDVVERYIRKLFPARLEIPATNATQNPEMQVLYDTRNRAERIRFAQQKRKEGYTLNDIALLLHSSVSTIKKYLMIPEEEIPQSKDIIREKQHKQAMAKKQEKIDNVKKLYSEGYSIDEISRLTGHVQLTVTKYLREDCHLSDGHYDQRIPGKLYPYEQDVIQMRAKGMTYVKIHAYITEKGYRGSVASLRMFMQKERTHLKNSVQQNKPKVEYVPRKFMCQLIYKELEQIKGLTQEQYEAVIKKFPVLGELYSLLKEFHRIVFSHKSEDLDQWIQTAFRLKIDELDSYLNGLKSDIVAVKNGIEQIYNNGLAEGSVNKIKLIKRIMYGRNSFELLKSKILLNEHFYQIN